MVLSISQIPHALTGWGNVLNEFYLNILPQLQLEYDYKSVSEVQLVWVRGHVVTEVSSQVQFLTRVC